MFNNSGFSPLGNMLIWYLDITEFNRSEYSMLGLGDSYINYYLNLKQPDSEYRYTRGIYFENNTVYYWTHGEEYFNDNGTIYYYFALY